MSDEHIVVTVDSIPCYNLQDVADLIYGDATKWKVIAAANGIAHPANIPSTIQNLILPDAETDQDIEGIG